MSLEEVVPGFPYATMTVSLSEGLNFSRQSLVVGVRGIANQFDGGYNCTATNDNETASVYVFIKLPGLFFSRISLGK